MENNYSFYTLKDQTNYSHYKSIDMNFIDYRLSNPFEQLETPLYTHQGQWAYGYCFPSKVRNTSADKCQPVEPSKKSPVNAKKRPRQEEKKSMAIDWIKDEISFLTDECASILIILRSLRNAYCDDTNFTRPEIKRRVPSDKEREIRIAYDDLLLQARQLGKKIDLLEIKSNNIDNSILEQPKKKKSICQRKQT